MKIASSNTLPTMTVQSFTTTNVSDSNNGTQSHNEVRQQIVFFELFCYSIIILVGVIANVVIIRKLLNRKRKSSEYFILNLAITDLVVCSLCIPLDIYDALRKGWQYGAFLCKIIWPFQTLFTLISILTLTAMAIERYRAIISPFKPRLTHRDLLKAIACIWLLGLCVIAPYIFYLQYDGVDCIESWPHEMSGAYYTLSLLVIDYCIPLTIITFCYGRAGYKLYVNTKEFEAVNAHVENHAQRTRLARNTRIIKIFSFAVLVFLICMLPGDIYWMWKGFGSGSEFKYEQNFKTLSSIMIYSNSCFNPFIFGACNFGCFKGRYPWSARRKLKLERLVSVNSLSASGSGRREKNVSHDHETQQIDFKELEKLRETDI
ncbi:galanin receptor type 1-like isoform X2 [Dendronephthya gigantea]|uniref:galanin receptor type 1-like isoform X2 n=1 Tax=Dendronephthya gigantea TaxID=151771 RepID=UPI00106B5134|nr:galanin receptor type 1-like isoform X2 [Dendronephthya gigantea]